MENIVSDQPIGFETYKTRRWMHLWADYVDIQMEEVKKSYPEIVLRGEWEAMLDRCAEQGARFSRQLLQSLTIEHQHGINRRSKGASLPVGFVISQAETVAD